MSTTPRTVTAPNGSTLFIVMNADDPMPASFALMATQAPNRVAIRFAGGCKGMTVGDKRGMIAFFLQAFKGYHGVVMSGATRQITADDQVDLMITEVPGYIAGDANNAGCIALGTAPRTADFSLTGESLMRVDTYGTIINPSMSAALFVQKNPVDVLDWDGDLPVYFTIMEYWLKYAKFTAVGLVVWNGGAVTDKEARTAAAKGWPVIIISGSGRTADTLIADTEFMKYKNVHVVSLADPIALHELLVDLGFIE